MKCSEVVVPWREGLHLRTAAKLVGVAQGFCSTISLRSGARSADLQSVLSILALSATVGTKLSVEASGEDEQEAIRAVEQAFGLTHGEENSAGPSPQTL